MRLDAIADMPFASPAEHLAAEFRWLDARISSHVARLADCGRFDESALRGVRLDESAVLASLHPKALPASPPDQLRARIDARAAAGTAPPLYRIARAFGLDAFERDALMIAAAPALDVRYRAALALAQNDATRQWATPDLVISLLAPEDRIGRLASFAADARLAAWRLLSGSEEGGPLADHALEVEDRVVLALTGSEAGLPTDLRAALSLRDPGADDWAPDLLETPEYTRPIVLFEGSRDVGQRALAARRASGEGAGLLCLRVCGSGAHQDGDFFRVLREARLTGAHLFVDARMAEGGSQSDELARLVRMSDGLPFTVAAQTTLAHRLWQAAPERVQRMCLPDLDAPARLVWWQRAWPDRPAEELAQSAWRSRMGPSGIRHASREAAGHAGLPAILRPVPARWSRDDLILPAATARGLDELTAFVSHWPQVLGTWDFAATHPQSRRCIALLSGPPGTGKTMAASIVAGAAGVALYRVSLSSIFDKYVGETEKQIDRLFDAAADAGISILCDEADALFAARSDRGDSHSKFNNLTVSHLLQRIDEHEGMVLLTSNLPQNMDEAFTRRIDHAITFPLPDKSARKALWRRAIPLAADRADNVDLDALAETFELSGGDISNAALSAAYLAAAENAPISMRHLLRAVERELTKIGRTPIAADFGRLHAAR